MDDVLTYAGLAPVTGVVAGGWKHGIALPSPKKDDTSVPGVSSNGL